MGMNIDHLQLQNQSVEGVYDIGNSGAVLAVDWDDGRVQKVILNDNAVVCSFANGKAGVTYILQTEQDAVTGRDIAFSVAAGQTKWSGGAQPNASASGLDIWIFFNNGSEYAATRLMTAVA